MKKAGSVLLAVFVVILSARGQNPRIDWNGYVQLRAQSNFQYFSGFC